MPLPSALAPKLEKTPVSRVECYYLGWLGNQDAGIQKKKAELAEAKAGKDLVVIDHISKELKDITAAAGTIELHDMHVIDFDEAVVAHPDDWVLAEDYKLPTGPSAPKIVDKRFIPAFPTQEQMKSAAGPPMVENLPMHERRGPGGGSLIPERG